MIINIENTYECIYFVYTFLNIALHIFRYIYTYCIKKTQDFSRESRTFSFAPGVMNVLCFGCYVMFLC
jgi:hypothetical protein